MSSENQQQPQRGAALHPSGPPPRPAQADGLNPNAPAFVPNLHASVFVPGQPFQPQHQQSMGLYQAPPPPHQQQWAPGGHQQRAFGHGGPVPPHLVQHPPPTAAEGGGGGGGLNSHADAPPQITPESWDDMDEGGQNQQSSKPAPASTAPARDAKRPVVEPKAPTTTTSSMPSSAPGGGEGSTKRPVAASAEAGGGEAEADDVSMATFMSKFHSNVVVDENRKERVNIVFIGHVDAGKSTIGGQLMYLTGMVDKRTLEKYEREAKEKGRESWYLSWALDTNDEEREKGKTVEVGRAFFETDQKQFTILDAPGHKSFVPNMISGATQADLAVLVISARKGEFETGFDRGGQTREHAMLVKTAGVKHLVVLVNKMDDPTVGWSHERYAEIQEKLNPYLRKCGFARTDVKYIPCSGLSGAFLKDRPPESLCSWYKDECFLHYIDNMLPKMTRDFNGPVRAIIADKYGDMGTVVIGKLESGVITKGQVVVVMPNRTAVQVLQLWTNDVETDQAYSGDNIKMKLKGVEESDVSPGFVVCSPEVPCKVGRIFDAEVIILEYKSIICAGYSCVLHIHAAAEEVSVKLIICSIDKKSGEKRRTKFVRQDDKCILRLESAEAFCLEAFKDFPQMGRFTLRDEGKTIAMGKVLKLVE